MTPRWWRRVLALVAFGCLWWNVHDDPPLQTGGYVLDVGEQSACLAMITAGEGLAVATVRGPDGAEVVRREELACRRHVLRFDGLLPATRYAWRIEADGVVESGTFVTAGAADRAPLRFAFLGDSGRMPWWVWLQRAPILHWPARWQWLPTADSVTRIGAAVAAAEPEFVLHLGDLVYPRGLHAHYSAGFFRPFAAVLRKAPVYAVLGNHDVMDAEGLQALANLPLSPNPLTGDGRCFSFARGPVRVIGIAVPSDQREEPFGPTHPGRVYLERELSQATEPWILVASHFPVRSASRQMDRGDLRLDLWPLLCEYGVSLYVSGHDHCYQRFAGEPDDPVVIVSGGGGKDLYEVNPAQRATWLRAVELKSRYHWCSVAVANGAMALEAIGIDGVAIDRLEVPLPSGAGLARVATRVPQRAARIKALR